MLIFISSTVNPDFFVISMSYSLVYSLMWVHECVQISIHVLVHILCDMIKILIRIIVSRDLLPGQSQCIELKGFSK